MDVSQTHLESLDEFDYLTDAAAKSFIVQLLSLISADASPADQKVGSDRLDAHPSLALTIFLQTIKASLKRIGSAGFNPGAIWTHLSNLRDTISSSVLTFPDPSEITSRTLRLSTLR